MFGIFKKKTKAEVLDDKYRKLIKESHRLSTINRKASDKKMAEANNVLNELENHKTE